MDELHISPGEQVVPENQIRWSYLLATFEGAYANSPRQAGRTKKHQDRPDYPYQSRTLRSTRLAGRPGSLV
jgi:hypothetical protein